MLPEVRPSSNAPLSPLPKCQRPEKVSSLMNAVESCSVHRELVIHSCALIIALAFVPEGPGDWCAGAYLVINPTQVPVLLIQLLARCAG